LRVYGLGFEHTAAVEVVDVRGARTEHRGERHGGAAQVEIESNI